MGSNCSFLSLNLQTLKGHKDLAAAEILDQKKFPGNEEKEHKQVTTWEISLWSSPEPNLVSFLLQTFQVLPLHLTAHSLDSSLPQEQQNFPLYFCAV